MFLIVLSLFVLSFSEIPVADNGTGMETCSVHKSPIYGFRALKYISFLFPKDVAGKEIVRVGRKMDGGYTMLNDFSNIHTAFGFGVGWDYSWDLDLASRNINVFMFDPTIKMPKLKNSRLKFYPIGISANDDPEKKMYSLESILKMDNKQDEKDMIMKIDIEGGEWDILHNLSSLVLEKFSQIVVEFHWLNKVLTSDKMYVQGLKVLEKLNKTHELIWVHSCNYYPFDVFGGVPFPRIFEAAYVKRTESISFTEAKKQKKK